MAKSKNESNNKNSGTLLTEKDGTQYFVMGKVRIKVSEHFAQDGKLMIYLYQRVLYKRGLFLLEGGFLTVKQPYNTTIYNTALYLRLSRDDELQGESGSIQTQRMMLRQYAAEHGLTVVDEYIVQVSKG